MKNKEEKKKPYRSVLSNIIWCLAGTSKATPLAFTLEILKIPLNIALSYAAIYLPSLVVAEVSEGKELKQAVLTVGALIFAMFLGNMLSKLFEIFTWTDLYSKSFRVNTAYKIYEKSLNFFYQDYEKKEVRDLQSRAKWSVYMNNGEYHLTNVLNHTFRLVENVMAYILFGTVVSFASPWLIVLLMVSPIVSWFCNDLYQKWEYKGRKERTDIDRKLWYIATKPMSFAAAKDIRIYSMTTWFKQLFKELSGEMATLDRKRMIRTFATGMADLLMLLIRDGAAYAFLIAMVLNGEITVDRFVLYFAAISTFAERFAGIIDAVGKLDAASLHVCDCREYLDYQETGMAEETAAAAAADITDYVNSPLEITFDNVSFRYDGADAEDTIKGISFTIKPGEKIALVGLNGAGKTTLVKLLCGLYVPTGGEIRINGTPINHFNRKEYYRLFSAVFQDVRAGFFSLAEIVAAGSWDIDLERVEKCLGMAGLGEKIASLSDGIHSKLDKQINKGGIELSGGELQKLMLARALYKDAPILVLDEPTAALDPIAESNIYKQYNEMAEGKNSLFISHRLASTRFCDRILYLENGVIKEMGTHEELVALGGKYSELYEVQSCWYKDDMKGGDVYEGVSTSVYF